MITSIEPGLYRPGQWGIRIENLVMNVPAATPRRASSASSSSSRRSRCARSTPAASSRALLRADEIDWLNALPRDGARAPARRGRAATRWPG